MLTSAVEFGKLKNDFYTKNLNKKALNYRSTLKHLILNSVADHSEAVLVTLVKFSEMLVNEHNDYFTLGCLWQACILSEWFTGMYRLLLNIFWLNFDICSPYTP